MFSVTIREKSGQVYTFHFDKPEVMIGRVKGNDVILPKQNISKRHSLVRVHTTGRFVIEDLASTNGTYVNGHRIASPVEISSDDKVYLGDFVMQFFDLGDNLQTGAEPPAFDEPAADEPAVDGDALEDFPPPPVDSEADQAPAIDLLDDALGDWASDAPPSLDDGAPEEAAPEVEAPDESTVAELESDAAVARMMMERARQQGEVETEAVDVQPIRSELIDAIAAPDPEAALESMDPYRMTGPVERLDDVLDGVPSDIPDIDINADAAATSLSSARVPEATEEEVGPPPTDHFETLLALYGRARSELGAALPSDASSLDDAEWQSLESEVVAFIDRSLDAGRIDRALEIGRLKRDLIYELAGLGPLEEMLDDADIHTIEVNGHDKVYISGGGSRAEAATRFSGPEALTAAVDRLVRATGLKVESGATQAQGSLADGTAVRVVWPPLCPSGPVVLLRKPRSKAATLGDLVGQGKVTAEAATVLSELVASRRSIAICGTPGVGRRTLLNALALEAGDNERLVVIEAGIRLHLKHDQAIRLDGTSSPGDGDTLIALASRLRPDRLLLGAVRGERIGELLDHACDGIAPWIGTFYGRSPTNLLGHLVHTYAICHPGVPAETCAARAAAAVDAVAAFSTNDNGESVLSEVCAVELDGGGLQTRSLIDG